MCGICINYLWKDTHKTDDMVVQEEAKDEEMAQEGDFMFEPFEI